ncbi:MAG: FtsX-like permease family protein [Spirosomataceae bacterium]
MNLLNLSWANLRDKKLNSFLSALLLTLGIGIISLLLLLNKQLDEQFRRNLKGIDMVVGAKGSPLQLILSSVYQIDAPTGNIPLEEVERLQKNPMVKAAIPLSMGDNYRGFRIVGTTEDYVTHFEGELETGELFGESMEVTIGYKVAEGAGLKVGDTFAGSHGFDQEGEAHGDHLYVVKGIFKPSGSVLDQLILTPLNSVWDIHADHDHGEDEEDHEEVAEVTSALITFRNPMALMTLPRMINENTKLQSALPSIEINRLIELLGVGIETLRALAILIMLIAGVSVFVSLYNSLKERKYEMALLLSMGATRTKLFFLLLFEGLLLALIGFIAGIGLSRLGLWTFSKTAERDFHYSFRDFSILSEEMYLLVAAIIIGILAAAIPSLGIYRINISKTLAED